MPWPVPRRCVQGTSANLRKAMLSSVWTSLHAQVRRALELELEGRDGHLRREQRLRQHHLGRLSEGAREQWLELRRSLRAVREGDPEGGKKGRARQAGQVRRREGEEERGLQTVFTERALVRYRWPRVPELRLATP